MANVEKRSEDAPNFSVPWLERWLNADFSWTGLAGHTNWLMGAGGSVQDFLRRTHGNASDADLSSAGVLRNCGVYGRYHVMFIPQEWATPEILDISADELLRQKQHHWENLLSKGGIRENSRGTLTGVELPPDIEQRLIGGFRLSFEWVRFSLPLRNIPRRGDRSFAWCAFKEQVIFHGAVDTDSPRSTVHFTWCEFSKPIIAQEFTGLDLLDINGSQIREGIEITDSNLSKLRLDDCSAKSLSMTDTSISGPVTLGMSKLEWVEWMNCTFDGHVLFVDSAIQKSIGWLACDFRSRVTLASMIWPSAAYCCASSSGSKFDGIVEISGGQPPPVQLFQEAEFRSKVSLNSFSDRAKRESFWRELYCSESQAEAKFNKKQHAQDVESGCRTLRKVAEAAGDVHSEQLWHRAELIARKVRGESASSEKVFSHLYGLLADYGLSISRPFVVLAIATCMLALVYAWLGGSAWSGSVDYRHLEQGFGYSLNRTLPIGVFADEGNSWRQQLLGSGGKISDIGIRVLATLQSIFSAILIYLGIMAVRRKFRIS